MTLSTDAKRARNFAVNYDKPLRADDPRFQHSTLVVHSDGSVFHLRRAFLLKWQDPEVQPGDWLIASPERKAEILNDPTYADHKDDGLWLLCFSEHHEFFFWPMAELASYAQFENQMRIATIGEVEVDETSEEIPADDPALTESMGHLDRMIQLGGTITVSHELITAAAAKIEKIVQYEKTTYEDCLSRLARTEPTPKTLEMGDNLLHGVVAHP